ncbi:MAG TPA: HipA domain-containing protein [Candidatus Nitrosotalea sp.]|nr:HipA domain-containing protein [Candidatus Nitrosotalea sp.]
MPRPELLGVWLYGRRIAQFTAPRPWIIQCAYTDEALETWPANIPLLSCSLPLMRKRQDASVFAAGLLPEGGHRLAVAGSMGVSVTDVRALLGRLGRDVAGAAVISAEAPAPRAGRFVPYTAEGLEAEVLALPDRPLAIYDDSELSIAGLQDKLLLVKLEDGLWARPVSGLPSTHILKIEDRRYPGLIEAEASCLRLARAVGLTTVDIVVETIANIPCLIVSRFDRRQEEDGSVSRIHQEDACQALARNPDADQGRGRYERAGGPRLVEIAGLLDRHSATPAADLDQLLSLTTFNATIGNADAHGRNVSLLHPAPGRITLAPVYDTVPTLLWQNLRAELAMTANGVSSLAAVKRDDLVAEAERWHHDRRRSERVSSDLAERLLAAAASEDLRKDVRDLVRARATRFLQGVALGGGSALA